jgi:hypothetical protein
VGTRLWAALAVALLAAALLSACGSSGSDSTGSTATETGKAQAKAKSESKSKESAAKPKQQTKDKGSSKQRSGGAGESGGSPKDVNTPLKVSGGGSGQFRTKGGDNSIQEYGGEADESELQEVAEIVHNFYVARAAQQWDRACTYLSKSNVEQLEQLADRSGQKNVDCGTVLKAFTRTLPASVEREITTVDARSFRHDSEQGFLIYYGAGKVAYAMPLRAEDGTWKVTALVGTTLG